MADNFSTLKPLATTSSVFTASLTSMAESSHRVCAAEVFRNGIIVTFADGKSALFPADLLYSSLSQAQELSENEEEEETSD
jgi:hypothetical protein